MEHRWSTRKPFTSKVVIECARLGRLTAQMHDVSLGGMFVETPQAHLPLNAPVIVSFMLPRLKHYGGYRLQAMIVRRAQRGAGLMFLDLGTGTVRSLRDAIDSVGAEQSEVNAVDAAPSPARRWPFANVSTDVAPTETRIK